MQKTILIALLCGALGVTCVQAQNNEVDRRRENQQDRIANGVKNGSLKAGETAKLEKQEARINKQVRQDRKANGGKLTKGEKKQVNKELNKESRRIYRDKHN